MTTHRDIESILSTSDTFCAAPEIPFTAPVEEITRRTTEYSETGVPCVITGFPIVEDDEQSPFHHSREWMESICTSRGTPILGFNNRFL